MKAKILGFLAAGLSLFAMPSHAVTVTLGSDTYTVTTVVGSFNDLLATLSAQPWFDTGILADSAVDQVGQAFGAPNTFGTSLVTPLALYSLASADLWNARALFSTGVDVNIVCTVPSCTTSSYTWLVVQRSVPEPGTFALLGLGLAGLGLSRRRKAN